MGRRSDGAEWRLPIGPHTLVAGSSGSGKGSVFWSFAFGLAPEVRAGRVQLHGVDLKGGMEILMGAGLFSTRATVGRGGGGVAGAAGGLDAGAHRAVRRPAAQPCRRRSRSRCTW